jgi:hypothetical protein
MADDVRIERDTFGEIEVPAARLWGAQTQRSLRHFRISDERMPPELIRALALVKRACATVNGALGALEPTTVDAIVAAADEVLAGMHDAEFPLVVWQTGSGTQTNMNMNEVLANRASELLGGERGQRRKVHANDDVNRGQSSNDVFPTAMHVAAVESVVHRLIPPVKHLRGTLAATASSRSAAPTSRTRPRSRSARSSPATFRSSTTASRTLPMRCRIFASSRSAGRRSGPGSTRIRSSATASRRSSCGSPASRSSPHRTSSRRWRPTTRSCTRTGR